MRFAMNVQPYQAPRNALLDLSPINEAFDTKIRMDQQGVENALRERDFGLRERQLKSAEADRAENRDFRQQQFKFQQDRAAADDKYRSTTLGLQIDAAKDAREKSFLSAAGGVAQLIAEDPDPARAQSQWQRLMQSDPRWQQWAKTRGLDPNDHVTGSRQMIAEVRGYIPEDKGSKFVTFKEGEQGGFVDQKTKTFTPVTGTPQATGPSKDQLSREADLRKEYIGQQTVKDFQTVRDAYSNVKATSATPSPAGDISLIFSYMKILDPQSVVREGEFATAQNAAGVPDRIVNTYNRMLSGERLNETQRADFVKQAESIYQGRERQYLSLRNQYGTIARSAGARPDQVTLDYGIAGPPPPPGATNVPGVTTNTPNMPAPQQSRPRAVNPQTGEAIEWDGQNWVRVN